MAGEDVDYGRLAREAELALRLDAIVTDVVEHARLIAEHEHDRFDPVGSAYFLDQFLTVAALDFKARAAKHLLGDGNLAIVIPHWASRFAVLTRTKLPVLECPGVQPRVWGGRFDAVGVATFGRLPNLTNPYFDFTAVYPCRAPWEDEW